MKDYLEIGPSPPEEDCIQLGEDNYIHKARIECNQYIQAIIKSLAGNQ